jgi:hypothetical protein
MKNASLVSDLAKSPERVSGTFGTAVLFTWSCNVRSLSEMRRRVNGDEGGGVRSGHFRKSRLKEACFGRAIAYMGIQSDSCYLLKTSCY